MELIREWFRRHLADPQVVILAVLLVIGSVVIFLLGRMLAPVLASAVIAYLLQGLVSRLERKKVPRLVAVVVVFLSFTSFLLFLLLGMLPLLWNQLEQLFQQLPSMISWTQNELLRLPERYPDFISEQQVIDLTKELRSLLASLGQRVLSFSVASVGVLILILVYIFLVPLLVFFLLKDRDRLVNWATAFLPEDRSLVTKVWRDLDQQIGNYIRGKFWEILIIWSSSFVTFTLLGLQFAMLVSLFVGLSVLIPFIGVIVMTFPVALIGIFQWGWSPDLAYVVAAYVVIQTLDGNLVAPLLFSEVVNLHPVAIVVAVLLFGGLFGFWGIFFAIPLATLVQAILKAWPRAIARERKEIVTQPQEDVDG